MIIAALKHAVRELTLNTPCNIIYSVFMAVGKGYTVEFVNTQDNNQSQSESLDGIQKFTVYPDRIAIDFPQGTLWLTKTGMEW